MLASVSPSWLRPKTKANLSPVDESNSSDGRQLCPDCYKMNILFWKVNYLFFQVCLVATGMCIDYTAHGGHAFYIAWRDHEDRVKREKEEERDRRRALNGCMLLPYKQMSPG